MLDTLAPKVKQKKKPKPPCPWYNSRLLDQRKIVRTRKKFFLKYREPPHWKAFIRERNRYITMLNYSKRGSLSSLVQLVQRDSKKSFRIVNSLLGSEDDNPMPPARTDTQLTEDFAPFFLDKIDRIREKFTGVEPY